MYSTSLSDPIRSILNTERFRFAHYYKYIWMPFNIISVVKEEDMMYVRQSQMIKVTNVSNKVQIEKEIRKHGNMPISVRGICGPSNCGKTNMLINLLRRHSVFENVYMSKLLTQTTKISIWKIY